MSDYLLSAEGTRALCNAIVLWDELESEPSGEISDRFVQRIEQPMHIAQDQFRHRALRFRRLALFVYRGFHETEGNHPFFRPVQ